MHDSAIKTDRSRKVEGALRCDPGNQGEGPPVLTSLTSAARQAITAYASHARKPSHGLPQGNSSQKTLKISSYLHWRCTSYMKSLRIGLPKAAVFLAEQSLCPQLPSQLPHSSIIQYRGDNTYIISLLGSLC